MSAGSSGAGSSDGGIHSFSSLDGPELSIEILEQNLLCPICFKLYEEPQVLRCVHCFCKTCLEGVIQNSAWTTANETEERSTIKCPVCQLETFKNGQYGPRNYGALKSIVEKYKILKAEPTIPLCEVHAEQPLNMYCSTDHKLICGVCATSKEHKGHAFSSLPKAANQEKILLEELIQELENRPDLLPVINTLKADRDKALQELSALNDQISTYFANLHHILDQRQARMVSYQELRMASLTRDYNGELGKITPAYKEQRDALEMARGLKSESEPLLFLQKMQEVREKVSLIQQKPTPTVTGPTDSGSITNFDVRTWDSTRLADAHTISLPAEHLKRRPRAPSTTSNSTWAWSPGILIFMLMMAAFFSETNGKNTLFRNLIPKIYNHPKRPRLNRFKILSRD
uniref:Tripartite motif-containing protein 59 n=1 Tax=Leptobrachium leishanense TaxID=445787 RepID=A0A8C5WHJ0_9ANUR